VPDGLLALALGAGLLAAVNPCGFALLPAYLSLLIVGDESPSRARAVGRALALTAAMTLGFAGVFAVFGLAVAPVAASLQQHLPWFTVAFGVGLAALGLVLAAGRRVSLPRMRGRVRNARPLTGSFASMTGFGAGYALASLTCTIAPFLAVVVAAFRTDSLAVGLILFLVYAAGMGLVVGTVAVAVALANDSLVRRVRRTGPWVSRVSGVVLLLAGLYVAYYGWWELRVLAGGDPDDPVVAGAAAVQHLIVDGVRAAGVVGWLVLGALVVAGGAVGRRRGHDTVADRRASDRPAGRHG
jgi:cytochrome c-type biogenesis protein